MESTTLCINSSLLSCLVRRAVQDVEYVFHIAGDTSFWNAKYDLQWRINVEGTRNIALACLELFESGKGFKRLVHCSTVDTLGYCSTGGLVDENTCNYNYGSSCSLEIFERKRRERERCWYHMCDNI